MSDASDEESWRILVELIDDAREAAWGTFSSCQDDAKAEVVDHVERSSILASAARSIYFHASAADVLSKFNIGLMGVVEARKKRLLLPVDFMWAKLSDDKGLPLSPFPRITSIKAKTSQTVLTPSSVTSCWIMKN